jgi:hypothetical protein
MVWSRWNSTGEPQSSGDAAAWAATMSSGPASATSSRAGVAADAAQPPVPRVSISRSAGLGGRVHPQIAWAKLDTLVKAAELATSQLWG